MTNEKAYSPVSYGCNGATVKFSFPWKILTQNDLTVYLKSADSVSTLKLGVDYSVKYEEMGGEITTLETYATGNSIMIYRNVSNLQGKSYSTSPGFQASEIEKSFDSVSCNLQEMDYNIENFKTTFTTQIESEIDNLESVMQDNKQELLTLQENFEDEVDNKLVVVSEAAEKIAEFEESVIVSVQASNVASEKAQEATNAVVEIENKIVANDVKMADTLQQAQTAESNAIKSLATTIKFNNISNCLLEIPQNIKLELADGVLTLKAGSKVAIPNGVDVFDEVITQTDVSATHTGNNGASFVYYRKATNDLVFSSVSTTGSGTTPPSSNAVYYNTSTNTINNINSSGAITDIRSLPLAIVQRTGSISSIDKVFNGFGYIGSTMFADKGVKGLIPNGRNADGTLNNIEFETQSVLTRTITNTSSTKGFIALNADNLIAYAKTSTRYYDEEKNYFFNGVNTLGIIVAGDFITVSGVFTELEPKNVFNAVDYNDALLKSDKAQIIDWGMPDYTKGINITFTSSGLNYTAPANGFLSVQETIVNNTLGEIKVNNVIVLRGNSGSNNYLGQLNGQIIVQKGDVITSTNVQTPTGTQYNWATFYPMKGAN